MNLDNAIYVTSIADEISEANLKDLFSAVGTIKRTEWNTSMDGGRTFTIEYASVGPAKAAVLLNNTPLGSKKLSIVTASSLNSSPSVAVSSPSPAAPTAHSPNGPASLVSVPALYTSPSGLATVLPGLDGLPINPALVPPADALQSVALQPNVLLAAQKRNDDIARTIYVGNLSVGVDEPAIRQFFSKAGQVLYVKLAGDTVAGVRYAFVEFSDVNAAIAAQNLSGQHLGDRQIKIGKANNPIVKAAATPSPPPKNDSVSKLLEQHKEALAKKLEEAKKKEEKDDKDKKRSRSPRKRSRSRSRGRRHRSRSRDRRRSRSRSRDRKRRSRSRSRDKKRRSRTPVRRPSPPRRPPRGKKGPDRTGQFWDGFQWHDAKDVVAAATDIVGALTANASMLQNAAAYQAMALHGLVPGTSPQPQPPSDPSSK